MELQEQILSKPEINSRVVEALLAIIANNLVTTKTDLAEHMGIKPAKFSEILNYRMNAGVDIIAKICDWYNVDPYWLLMGRGNHIFRSTDVKVPPYFIEDENDLDREYHSKNADDDKDTPNALAGDNSFVEMLYKKNFRASGTNWLLTRTNFSIGTGKGKKCLGCPDFWRCKCRVTMIHILRR